MLTDFSRYLLGIEKMYNRKAENRKKDQVGGIDNVFSNYFLSYHWSFTNPLFVVNSDSSQSPFFLPT